MPKNNDIVRKRTLSIAIGFIFSPIYLSHGQQTIATLEEVLIIGVRGALESAVNLKRESNSVVDGIAAEDIGKLPDVTIADSLQRISGVQVQRSAGEGGSINIRGLPQVISQLNGEVFMSAGSIDTVQPDFGDIPSQLFKGADVYKSARANLATTGITGTVNLKTYRPFDLDDGLTASGSFELQAGSESNTTDPVASALMGWRSDKFGALFNIAYANVNLANYYNGANTSDPTGSVNWTGRSQTGVSDHRYNMISDQGVVAWNQVTERERIGFNTSVQTDIGEGFSFIADIFYTEEDEYNRKVGASLTNKWQSRDWFTASRFRPTDVYENDLDSNGNTIGTTEWATVQEYTFDAKRLKSFTQNDSFLSDSKNTNLELRYDNGGPITANVRYATGEATRKRRHGYNEGDMTNGTSTGINPFYRAIGDDHFLPGGVCDIDNGDTIVGSQGGCFKSPNPLGYGENPQITYNTHGTHPVWSGFNQTLSGGLGENATVADYMNNLEGYNIGAFSSENNANSKASFEVLRFDGQYKFESAHFFKQLDFGIRTSKRSVSEDRYHLFSPFYEQGCEVQWKATDVVLGSGSCQPGETIDSALWYSLYDSNGTTYDYDSNDGTIINPQYNPSPSDPSENYQRDQNGNIVYADDGVTPRVIPERIPSATELFQPYTALEPIPLDQYNHVIKLDNFGPVSGIPAVWAVYPKDYDDPEAFHNRVFGSTVKANIPGTSYNVDHNTTTFYLQGDFSFGRVQGNIGVRHIETELVVKQNTTGAAKPYGNTNVDSGDVVSRREYTDTLPALNLSVDLTDDLIFRFAAAKNMVPLDLNNWGDGLAINTALDASTGVFRVTTASLNGNPNLKPWRSNNLDASLEWYVGGASLLSAGAFYVDIDSFTTAGTIPMQLADADGQVNTINVQAQVQGDGGSLQGVEIGAKLAFSDFTDTPFISDFGIDTNYTYSPSEQNVTDVEGNKLPFQDNSENQFNFVGWYQNERFQARIAYNYRSERLQSQGNVGNLALYQSATSYVDISASYDISDYLTVYANGSNVTQEYEDYYLQWKDQYAFQNYFEPRYAIGIRARF